MRRANIAQTVKLTESRWFLIRPCNLSRSHSNRKVSLRGALFILVQKCLLLSEFGCCPFSCLSISTQSTNMIYFIRCRWLCVLRCFIIFAVASVCVLLMDLPPLLLEWRLSCFLHWLYMWHIRFVFIYLDLSSTMIASSSRVPRQCYYHPHCPYPEEEGQAGGRVEVVASRRAAVGDLVIIWWRLRSTNYKYPKQWSPFKIPFQWSPRYSWPAVISNHQMPYYLIFVCK